MTEAERDEVYARLFADPKGVPVLADLEERSPHLAAEIKQRIKRMRSRWRTGAA